jgi:hypothetical protein
VQEAGQGGGLPVGADGARVACCCVFGLGWYVTRGDGGGNFFVGWAEEVGGIAGDSGSGGTSSE